MNRKCVLGGLNLSKVALGVSVDQKASKIQDVKLGGLKKSLDTLPTMHFAKISWFDTQMMGSFSRFDRPQLCSSLIFSDSQYLFGEIYIYF